MSISNQARVSSSVRFVPGIAAVCAMTVGGLVLIGWEMGNVVLTSVLASWSSMKVNTALGLLLSGFALWCLRAEGVIGWRRRGGLAAAILVTLVGALTLGQYVFGVDIGIDQLLARQVEEGSGGDGLPGRMSEITAVCFVLIGWALAGLEWRGRGARWIASVPALAAGVIGLLAFAGYLYGVKALYSISAFSSMAVHTALSVVFLAIGILCARAGDGPLHLLTSPGMGGRLTLRLLPVAIVLPLLVGWLRLLGQQAGFYGFEVGLAIFAISNVAIFSLLIWRNAAWLDRAGAELRESERRHRELIESLPQLVWTCVVGGACDYLSPQWVAYTGLEAAKQLGRGWLERIHPDDREQTFDRWRQSLAAGRHFAHEYRLRRHDGVYRWFDVRAEPLRDADGRIVKWFGTNTDIEERKVAQGNLARLNRELEERVAERTRELSSANEALGRTAGQLQVAQRISHVGSWELQVATGRVQWSDELFRIAGLDTGGEPPNYAVQASMFSSESWERLTRTLAHTVATGQGYELELEIIRPGGERRWVMARGEATRGPGGEVATLSGTLQDVTELKRAQTELERAMERIRLAARAGEFGIWDWNVADNRLIWDETMYRLYGIAPDAFDAAYEAWSGAVHPGDRAATEAVLLKAMGGEADFDPVFRIIRPDGAVRFIQAAALVHRDGEGRALRMVGVNLDITERREAEQALRANEALLRDFVKHAPAAIAMLDERMCYLQVSDRWLTDYKLRGPNLIGRCHYDVFSDVPERWKEIHRRVLAGAVERCDDDPFPRADGGMDWLQWEARPWFRGDGGVGGLIFFTQVITARKRMELLLSEQKEQLERSNRDLEQFAYAASHDLQEPLRAVSGCAQILGRRYSGKLDAGADDLIRHVVEGAERMQTLILDLLTFSRVSTEPGNHEPVDSSVALAQARANLGTSIRESGAKVTAGPLPTVRADPSQLTQVFQNLIGNALKYRSAHPPEIRVEAVRREQAWEFSVRDNGIGIEAKYFERIFLLFQRLHTRGEYPGTGIGLALCKKIVERHGGRIGVESTPAHGSVFIFTLPCSPGD